MENPQSRSDWLQLAFWLVVAVLIVAGGMAIAWLLLTNGPPEPECLEEFTLGDPTPHAYLFLTQLQEDGVMPRLHPNAAISNFGWFFDGRRVEFVVVLEGVRWSGIPCYMDGEVEFREITSEPIVAAQ